MSAAILFSGLLILAGLGGIGFGIYAMVRGGKDDDPEEGGLGPIPERGIHVLAGARMLLFGLICVAAGIFALTRFS